MKNYCPVMVGQRSAYASECFSGGFIGADFGIQQDLSGNLPDAWREFNKQFIPVFLASHPDKTKIGAGLAGGVFRTVSKGIKTGDLVLCPGCSGRYRVGEVIGEYEYQPAPVLPHRRPVRWLDLLIDRTDMSDDLRHSAGSMARSATSAVTATKSRG